MEANETSNPQRRTTMNKQLKRWAEGKMKSEGLQFKLFCSNECIAHYVAFRNGTPVVLTLSGTRQDLTFSGSFVAFSKMYSDAKIYTPALVRGIAKAQEWLKTK